MTEQLSEKIIGFVRINDSSYMPNEIQLRVDIEFLIKEAGYGLLPPLEELEEHYHAWAIANGYRKLAKDQSLPFGEDGGYNDFNSQLAGVRNVVNDMLKQGFRRVEMEVIKHE